MRFLDDGTRDILLIVGGLVAVLIGTVALVVNGADFVDCQGFQAGTGIETKWRFGCYAKVDGAWVPKAYVFGNSNELRIRSK